jgi:hypothetical protein
MHRIKEKGLDTTTIGTIYTEACLAPRKMLASMMLHDVVPLSFTATAFFSCRKPHVETGLHDMHVLYN